ncbi:MAG: hypothetical protein U5N85_15590 [Arcicella sp.]|nr:hypothetical protein [Arcicella sp.]
MMMNQSNIALEEDVDAFSEELVTYFQNKFSSKEVKKQFSFVDEPYINSWEGYCNDSVEKGTFEVLKKCYPQLNFPIEEDINKRQDYIDAVLRGKTIGFNENNTLNLHGIEFEIYKSIAGKVPVIKVPDNQDFIQIIQSLLHKNNPALVPASMGAILINGINNWDRLHTLKQNWLDKNPFGNWNEEFSNNVLSRPNLFKDKIIVLSTKPYSNVAASSLGLSEDVWKSYSYSIRLEHECTHLYTLKKYGYASNNLHDELIADYIGITKTIGYYSKAWMLAFMGLEEYPKYRKGARLENYLGSSSLSLENFEQLTVIIKNAIENITLFDSQLGKISSAKDQMNRIDTLCEVNVLDTASSNGADLLLSKYGEICDYKNQF